ncbi:hypothetical protein [Halomonas sp. Y3]|uniref:hypothetical protein n=1 Tax=Halomonas sp. Y3 TaxID=2956797 RepID=UPI00209EC696|nr:hypothetical protein [Halomonas sp. Y3]
MTEQTPQPAHQGTYLIIHCWKRYEAEKAGWYRIFGAGGLWNTYLEDRRFSPSGDRPPYVGQLLTQVRLWPRQEERAITRRIVNIVSFSVLEPVHPGIRHDDLYPS